MRSNFEKMAWLDLRPRRKYVADSSVGTPGALRAAVPTKKKIDQINDWHELGEERIAFADGAKQWRGKLDEQSIKDMADYPLLLQSLVVVGRIMDTDHPVWAGESPAYGAFAAQDIARHTVLGCYGGLTKLLSEHEKDQKARKGSDAHYGFDLSMTGDDTLVVDGHDSCNELAFVNDYRTDIERYAEAWAQRRSFNAAPVEVWLPSDTMPR